jgi:hypothetical protein
MRHITLLLRHGNIDNEPNFGRNKPTAFSRPQSALFLCRYEIKNGTKFGIFATKCGTQQKASTAQLPSQIKLPSSFLPGPVAARSKA